MKALQQRPRDIFDSDLSIHISDFDNLMNKFLENLTLDQARFFIRTVVAHSESAKPIKNYYKFIYRINWYMSQLDDKSNSSIEFIEKYKEFRKDEL